MVDARLINYIRAQLSQGYSPVTVRTALLRAGYATQDINEALRSATQPQKRFEIAGRNLIFILGGILAIVLLIIAGFIILKPAPKDIRIALDVQKAEFTPGENLVFTITLTSPQAREVPVSLEYTVREPFSRKIITTRTERTNVGASVFSTKTIPLPQNIPPAEYEVIAVVRYENLMRTQTQRFTVTTGAITPTETRIIEQPPEEFACPPSCDDLNPATEDFCERGNCIHRFKESICGNGACEPTENKIICPEDCGIVQDKSAVQSQALSVSRSDPEKAATLCNTLVLPEDADPCFATIAASSKKSALCTNIRDDRARDNCLMDFALANDFSVCPQISNRYLLTSCQSLARLYAAPAEQAQAEQEIKEIQKEVEAE